MTGSAIPVKLVPAKAGNRNPRTLNSYILRFRRTIKPLEPIQREKREKNGTKSFALRFIRKTKKQKLSNKVNPNCQKNYY